MAFTSTGGRIVPVTPSNTNYITGLDWVIENNPTQTPSALNLSTETFTLASSGLANGDVIVFDSVGTVTGISINTQYYIIGVSGNDFQISLTYGGSAVAMAGATTTLPTFRKTLDIQTVRKPGYITVQVSGNVAILPLEHFDTDSATETDMGAQVVYIAAGAPFPTKVKKVFLTGTTATGIKCITDN